ncbi:MAG: helix-turn-helix domain-containing protein [Clostridia bacterium]|nr:helix-turn-helix domain-containing protein [Clostridia bacterium]
MNNIQFSKSFYFFECNFKRSHHTDNSRGTSCHHIGYVKSGSATFDVEGKIYTFAAGDVFYTPPACKYHSYWQGEKICYDSYAFSVFPMESGEEYGVQKLYLTDRAAEILASLSANKTVDCTSVGLLYLLLGEVQPNMTPTVRDERSLAAARALTLLREDFTLNVPSLSKKLGMSVSAVYALFSDTLSSTPMTEKNRIRTETAVEMLTNTDLSVEEISARLGFSSAAYFRKVLAAFYGKTPREIRKFNNN